jgi:hypothetical protein
MFYVMDIGSTGSRPGVVGEGLHERYTRQALVAIQIEALKVRETIEDGRREVAQLVVGQNEGLQVRQTVKDGRRQVAQVVVVQIEVPKVGETVEDGPRQLALTQLVMVQIEVCAGTHVVEHAIPQSGDALVVEEQLTAPVGQDPVMSKTPFESFEKVQPP